MITLGSITISDNMYLGGVTQAKQVIPQQLRTSEGLSLLTVHVTPGGRTLTLGTTNLNGATQGIWCQSTIDEIKDLEATAATVVLDHNGDIYNVKIVDTSDFSQFFQNEPVSPDKKYTGKITMIEV